MTLLEQFDSLFDITRDRLLAGNGVGRAFVPAADLVVNDDEVTVFMDVPGLKSENLEIEVTGDVLTVRGERSYPYGDQQGDRSWYRLERGFGKFQRLLQVPKGIDASSIRAELVDGVLTLHIPQPEARKPRRIEISAGAGRPEIESSASEQPELAGAAA
ncbi:MAG TPA: HSP20 family small heat-shock protein [Solirubrobacteraceae bacterium]|nr:HSP20 family small heat-shock protein [Solirubrobacteraceae bacterium]